MLLLLLLIGGGSSAWGETKTGTIKFGTNNLKISSANVTGNDDLNNSWSVVTVGTTSFTQQPNYSQVGKKDAPATSIAFTMSLPSDVKFTSFSAKFGGFNGTAGNISLTVDGNEVGSGSLSATTDVKVGGELKTATTGKELKVTVTNIAKGVKCYNISYTYEDSSTPQPGEVAVPTLSLEEGTYWKTQTLTIGIPEGAADVQYTLDGTDPKESNTAELITKATNLELSATTTVRAIAVDNNDNYSKEVSRTYTFVPSIANTKETAYTTAQAIEIINKTSEAQLKDEVVYVKGVVSKIVTPFDSNYGNVSFDVSVDGSTEGEQFRFYRTQKDAENKYKEDPNIEVGATVIGCGTLLLYKDNKTQEDIYEFAAGNYLVDYKAPVEKVLKSIAISGEATKTTYFEGEVFDPTGLVVTATYEDESTEVVTSRVEWTFNPETLILGTTEVNVTATYGEKTASKTVAVTVAEVQKYNVTWNVNGNDYTEGNPTTEVVEGEKVEVLPAAPASIVGLVFMGWTNEAVTSQEAAPAVLFTSAADAPAVTADVTYYAVFAAQAGAGWTRVTALGDITEGSYVIKNADFVLPSSNTGSGEAPGKVLAPSITGNVITGEVDESMVWQFVSTGTSNQFYVKNAAGDYLYANKSNDGVRVHRTSDKWTFEENGEGYFSMKDANSNRYCAAGSFKGAKDWRSYELKTHENYENGGKLELYRNDISYSNYTTTVETNSLTLRAFDGKNYFATFSSDKAVKFVDATVYAVGVNDDRLILTEVESKQVPANTGVLLKSAGTEATYSVIGSAPAIENNLLCASVEEGQTTAADGTTEGYSFFKLSYNQAGENEKLGFYWAKENGAPFVSKAGLAYLAVKTADVAAVKGFSLFDMETGISKVSGSAAGNGVIYDLQGRRVERAVRGLYIVNGRKVMVK